VILARVRRRLVALALLVLLCELGVMAATGIALAQPPAGDVQAVTHDEITCTCTHGPDAECPMHKAPKAHPPAGASPREPRWCTGCSTDPQIVLTPFAFVGPLVTAARADAPRAASAVLDRRTASPIDFARPPVPPPPRA
jgi:hypothetical protein